MEPLSIDRYMVFHPDHDSIVNAGGLGKMPGIQLSAEPGYQVKSYRELLKAIAALSYYNSRFRLLFRGQTEDYRSSLSGQPNVRSSLYPSILRQCPGEDRRSGLDRRFARLQIAEEKLISVMQDHDLHQDRIARWAILQHYEVVPTPLLDVTASLQIALSFALADNRDTGYLYVLAFPLITGPISVSIESMTQVVDLSQICPPEALRPHFQVGMLVGDYPVIENRQLTHGKRGMLGNSFACRLISKFELTNCLTWNDEGFTATRKDILYPDTYDEWYSPLQDIKNEISAL